jgi:transposase
MIWDGAGFHTSKQLRVPENISLVQLPAYSPELNPIENLWHYLGFLAVTNRIPRTAVALLPLNPPPCQPFVALPCPLTRVGVKHRRTVRAFPQCGGESARRRKPQ